MNDTPFNVVKGSEAAIKSSRPLPGYLWFALDTRKIYYSDGEDFISMGGNSSVFYGTLTWSPDNLPDTDQVEFDFTPFDIEGNATPNINDLILNSDGCFYRVMSVDESVIHTNKLTIAGSGSGGGSGGGGGTITTSVITISVPTATKYFLEDEAHPSFTFSAHSTIERNNRITKITYTIGTKTFEDDEPHNFGDITLDLSKYFNSISENGTTLSFIIEDVFGARKTSSTYTLRKVKLILTPDATNSDDILLAENKLLQYKATPTGSNSISNVVMHYNVYMPGSTSPIASYEEEVNNLTGSAVSKNLTFASIDTINNGLGAYSLEVYCTGAAGGQTIMSNVLTHSVISYAEAPILVAYIPNYQVNQTFYVSQYDSIDLSYEIAKSTEDNQKARITFNVDGNETVQEVEYNNIYKFNIYFETTGFHSINVADSFGHIQSFNNIYVNKYDGSLLVIDNGDIDLKLNLTARGRTNNEILNTREVWADSSRTGIASLENFVWGNVNGWLTDDKHVNMLRLSSGAEMTVNDYEPFGLNNSGAEGMATGKSIELDFRISDVTDYSQPLITCLSYDSNDNILCGFNITGEVATFNTHKIKATGAGIVEGDTEQIQAYNTQVQGLTSKFAEGERIHLTWVILRKNEQYPMIKTYINGIVSGITQYTGGSDASSDSIAQNTTDNAEPALIKVNSNSATVDIYNIRVYDKTLSDRQVLENYIATLSTTEEKANCYANNIGLLDSNGKISINNIESGNYNIQLPYIKFTGGGQCRKDDSGYWLTNADGTNHLPRSKKDYRLVNHFDFVYPADSSRNVDLVSEVADNGLVNGVVMYGQGTSSMEYPVKNLRIKFKMKKNGKKVKFQVNTDSGRADYPVDILTLKADYMESSSSHNTGTANLVFDSLEALGFHTPGQTYWNTLNPDYKTLTAIRGYPIICFFRPDEDSDFEFIGRYNLNMDKSSEEAFGFLPVPAEEEEIEVDGSNIEFGWIENHGLVSGTNLDPEEHPYVNAIHCYEFLNNASNLDNFICPDKYRKAYRDNNKEDGEKIDIFNSEETYYIKDGNNYIEVLEPTESNFRNYYIKQNFEKSFYQKEYDDSGKIVANWLTSFESRYPEDSMDVEAFYQMCAWLNATNPDEATNELLETSVIYKGTTYTIDNREYRLAKFTNEFEEHFDKNFVIFYYVLTHVLLMIDSRAKNMMIATWDNQHWYPIFYDMDTMLGLNNYGYNKFDYNVEDKDENVFNGQASVLWNNLKICFAADINTMYNNMQAAKALDYENLLRNYNEVQADMWNEIMYNYDADYKYIQPLINGYYDGKSGKWVNPGTKNYLYAAQGSRSMHRKYWIKNRIAYFNGKYLSDAYKEDKFTMRLYTPLAGQDNYFKAYDVNEDNFGQKTYYIRNEITPGVYTFTEASSFVSGTEYYEKADNRLANSLNVVPPNNNYTLTPLHNQYLSVAFGGGNGQTSGPWYAAANEPYLVTAPAGALYNDTETYVYGASLLKDLGDLSSQYLGLFSFPGETKLERLILGNKTNGYYNPNFSALSIGESAPQLKYLDISNTLLTGDLSLINCQSIEEVYACGSSVTSIGLPSYGVLRVLRLPSTTTALVLDTLTKLTNENFTIGTYDSLTETYSDAVVPNLQTISIEGMPQFDSYSIVKKNCEVILRYCLRDINWTVGNSEIVDTVNNDGLKGIYVFEKLIARNAQPQYKGRAVSTIKAVTGSIIFGNDISAEDMLAVYEHYSSIYPDLIFVFDETNIKHINLYDGDGNIYWTKPITSGSMLTSAFYGSSSSGVFTTPRKTSTIQYQYTFENKWYIDNDPTQEVDGEYPILNTAVEIDIDFYPVFNESLLNYTITYHINDSTEIETYEYGTSWMNTLPKYIPYCSENDLPAENSLLDFVDFLVYPFLGYSVDRADKDSIFDFYSDATFVSSNREFFAIFDNEKVSVKDSKNVFYPAWDFVYRDRNLYNDTMTISGGLAIPNGNSNLSINSGYSVKLKADWTYYNFVTIPAKTRDGINDIYKLELTGGLPANIIDRVYCENGSKLYVIDNYCFLHLSRLKYFDFPSTLRQIGTYAFAGAKLRNQVLGSENTTAINDNAFNNALYGNSIIIPSNVSVLGNFSCSYNDDLKNWTLLIGNSLDKSVLDLSIHSYTTNASGRSIFGYNTSNEAYIVLDVYFYSLNYNSWDTNIGGYNILQHFFGDNAPAECSWHIG